MSDDIVEREVLGEASEACRAFVDRVRARVVRTGSASASELSQYAAVAFETYSQTLLRALLAAVSRRDSSDGEAWVRRQFRDGLDRIGTPLREAVADCPHRHAVAQRLQQQMFEAELMLRRALKTRFSDPALGVAGPADAVGVSFAQRKIAG
jgi:hypothetical protein